MRTPMMAYYARPMNLYGTPQEDRDKALIGKLGYEVLNINKASIQAAAVKQGMDVFRPLVAECNILVFRSFTDWCISAGVAREIEWAEEMGIPVLELPTQTRRRALSPDETRAMLRELGHR